MTHVAAHVDEDGGIRVPSLSFPLYGIYIPAYVSILAAVTHPLVEGAGVFGVFGEPEEDRQGCLVGYLEGCVFVIFDVLVVDLGEEIRKSLVVRAAGVEPGKSSRHCLKLAGTEGVG